MTATPEQIKAMCGDSIVRRNLLHVPHYTPYCAADNPPCRLHWPRTHFDGEQFKCDCGYRTAFPADFIAFYLENCP